MEDYLSSCFLRSVQISDDPATNLRSDIFLKQLDELWGLAASRAVGSGEGSHQAATSSAHAHPSPGSSGRGRPILSFPLITAATDPDQANSLRR